MTVRLFAALVIPSYHLLIPGSHAWPTCESVGEPLVSALVTGLWLIAHQWSSALHYPYSLLGNNTGPHGHIAPLRSGGDLALITPAHIPRPDCHAALITFQSDRCIAGSSSGRLVISINTSAGHHHRQDLHGPFTELWTLSLLRSAPPLRPLHTCDESKERFGHGRMGISCSVLPMIQ